MAEATNHIKKIAYEIHLDGALVPAGLIALSVNDSINRIPRARLEFNYHVVRKKSEEVNYSLTPATGFETSSSNGNLEFAPGKKITIQLGEENKLKEIFAGYITKQNISASNSGKLTLCIDCKHAANKMTLTTRTRFLHHDAQNGGGGQETEIQRINDDSSLEHLVNKGDYGLQLKIDDEANKAFEHENMLQYNCSDWDFLITRAEATGRVCRVLGNEIHVLAPKLKNSASMELVLGKNLLEYEAENDETQIAHKTGVASWTGDDVEIQKLDESIQNSNAELENVQAAVFLDHGGILSENEAKAWLENRLTRQAQGKVQGLAKIQGTVEVSVADTVKISGFDSVWDRDAFVSGIGHVFKNGGWFSYVQCGLSAKTHAENYLIGTANSSADFMPAVNGLLFGKVVGYKEGETGEMLIEVEIASVQGEQNSRTVYARLATFSAGENGGAVFRPFPNDEVVLGFINNDPRFPIVLGSLYNGKNKPGYELSNNAQEEVGFILEEWKISINKEDKTLSITSENGQQLLLDENNKKMTLAFDDNNSIVLDKNGIVLKGSKIEIEGSQGVKIKGAKVETTADATVDLKGAKLSLSADALLELKAQMTQIN